MKILKENGFKYSRGEFKTYAFRAKVKIKTVDDEFIVDIYTTDPDKQRVEELLIAKRAEKVTSLRIFHWCTKKEDDAVSKMLDEILNKQP